MALGADGRCPGRKVAPEGHAKLLDFRVVNGHGAVYTGRDDSADGFAPPPCPLRGLRVGIAGLEGSLYLLCHHPCRICRRGLRALGPLPLYRLCRLIHFVARREVVEVLALVALPAESPRHEVPAHGIVPLAVVPLSPLRLLLPSLLRLLSILLGLDGHGLELGSRREGNRLVVFPLWLRLDGPDPLLHALQEVAQQPQLHKLRHDLLPLAADALVLPLSLRHHDPAQQAQELHAEALLRAVVSRPERRARVEPDEPWALIPLLDQRRRLDAGEGWRGEEGGASALRGGLRHLALAGVRQDRRQQS
mmetsp:Transcript_82913/g.257555  ORF Transcript_82913/g.257555 Transcript_82913/m.257555 type:complete len:306 (+) Transcript_82913:322-1239(+)